MRKRQHNDVLEQQGQRDIKIQALVKLLLGFNEPGTLFDSVTHIVDLTESTIKANSRYFNEYDVPKQAISMGLAIFFSQTIIYSHLVKKRAADHTFIKSGNFC